MPFRRPNSPHWYVQLSTPGGSIRKSTGTPDRATARAIERALHELVHRRVWDLLNAMLDDRITVGELYDAVRHRAEDDLRAKVNDVDLEPLIPAWEEVQKADIAPDTMAHYRYAVHSLIVPGKPFLRSRFTAAALEDWLARYKGKSGTRRKAHAAMAQFAKFLVRRRIITGNPMRDVEAPRPGKPRCRWLEVPDLVRLADAQPAPYRVLSALLGGTGIEVSVALALRARDVDHPRREIRAAGTKTHARDRIVRVAEWAWPYVAEHCRQLLPNAPLFPHCDRWRAQDHHKAAREAVGIEDYRVHDERHSYAVRAARAGTPPELIARQLGHANAILVLKVYGRFMPSQQERDKWERIAAQQDSQHVTDQAIDFLDR
jgi:integrase